MSVLMRFLNGVFGFLLILFTGLSAPWAGFAQQVLDFNEQKILRDLKPFLGVHVVEIGQVMLYEQASEIVRLDVISEDGKTQLIVDLWKEGVVTRLLQIPLAMLPLEGFAEAGLDYRLELSRNGERVAYGGTLNGARYYLRIMGSEAPSSLVLRGPEHSYWLANLHPADLDFDVHLRGVLWTQDARPSSESGVKTLSFISKNYICSRLFKGS